MKHNELLDRPSERPPIARMLEQGRLKCGLTQKKAAPQLGITPPYLSRLERGAYLNPSPRILIAAARLYSLPLADLYAAAGYVLPSELPALEPYLHATCKSLPSWAIREMVHFCEYIQERYGGRRKDDGENLGDKS